MIQNSIYHKHQVS